MDIENEANVHESSQVEDEKTDAAADENAEQSVEDAGDSKDLPVNPDMGESAADDADSTSDAHDSGDDDSSDSKENESDSELEGSVVDPKAQAKIRRVQREAKNLRERAKTAEAKALRYEVAYELGIPVELVGRLQGDTREELVADAQALQKLLGGKAWPRSAQAFGIQAKEPKASDDQTDLAAIGERIFKQ